MQEKKSCNKASPSSLHSPTGKQLMCFSNELFFFLFFFFYCSLIICAAPAGEAAMSFCTRKKPESLRSWREEVGGRLEEGREGRQVEGGDGCSAPCTAGRGSRCRGRVEGGPTDDESKVWRKTSPQTIPSARLRWSCLVAAAPASDTHTAQREGERDGERGKKRGRQLRFETVIIVDQVMSLKPRAGPHSSAAVRGRQHADLHVPSLSDSLSSRHSNVETLIHAEERKNKYR